MMKSSNLFVIVLYCIQKENVYIEPQFKIEIEDGR